MLKCYSQSEAGQIHQVTNILDLLVMEVPGDGSLLVPSHFYADIILEACILTGITLAVGSLIVPKVRHRISQTSQNSFR